ncbi:MAG: bifunctional (p)ppGpp synthetase/guanosine-3',5'-bis(diphosphate) 3'-pyrophosphohydrolase [Clostridia bacterium]|nr:bifunctional (p)ppGpp synthetase/guanosine-3',5'-bis(diphosphate) 3'-pyrophosphohydrolase [Clostridia bacterium]
MIYTEMTKKAMRIAYHYHHGQLDKSDIPYIFHPIHLAEQMEDELTTTVALLHDLVEDTACTEADLRRHGFPDEVVEAVMLLTHDEAVPYLDYVRAMKGNRLATAVKLADLTHNSDTTRLDYGNIKEARLAKYREARRILTEE